MTNKKSTNPLIDEIEESGIIKQLEIALPTLAAFYPIGEVLASKCDPNNVTVRPISILEETALNDPMMLVSGRGVTKLLKRIVPEIKEPEQLCDVDVQAIILASRIVSHGNDYDMTHVCSECKKETNIKVDLMSHMEKFIPFTEEEHKIFDITLPLAQHQVRLMPIKYKDSIDIILKTVTADQKMHKFADMPEESLFTTEYILAYREQFDKAIDSNIDAIVGSIYFVQSKKNNKYFNKSIIKDWLLALPIDDIKFISNNISIITTMIQDRTKLPYTCPLCQSEQDVYLNLDPQRLFMQAEDQIPEKSSSAESKPMKKPSKAQSRLSQR